MPSRRLRADLPFQRVAVVLTGGGAWGAYEVGALKALGRLGIKPHIVAGVSVGALNAVAWVAHSFDTGVLERVWRGLSPASVGFRWTTIALRAFGGVLIAIAVIEFVLLLGGTSSGLVLTRFRSLAEAGGYTLAWLRLEGIAWVLLAVFGWVLVMLSHNAEDLLVRFSNPTRPERMQRWSTVALLVGAMSYALVALLGWPWPLRFHLMLVLGGLFAWLAGKPGPTRDLGRWIWERLMPETRGRGMWRGVSRRRLLEQMVDEGRPGLLIDRSVRLVISACDMNSGRMTYFLNPPAAGPEFEATMEKSLGEVAALGRVAEIIDAAVASSAVPVLYEPERFMGREYLDGGLFSNQPLRAVAALGADAILLVLVSPSAGPSPSSERANLIDIASRLNELSNWRDLQTELRDLPAEFSRDARPANVCVIEPQEPLGGSMFDFDTRRVGERLWAGEQDAWKALEAAGWLEGESAPPTHADDTLPTLPGATGPPPPLPGSTSAEPAAPAAAAPAPDATTPASNATASSSADDGAPATGSSA